ncbi:MAG: serine hydrolase domain-containing protein [Pseudomonadota bacterium]
MSATSADAARLGFDPDRLARIETWMARNREIGRYTGSSLLLTKGGETVLCAMDGHRDAERAKPYERDTIVRIYSMTKLVTSVAMMMQVEKGLVHLEAPVSAFIPEFGDMTALVPGAERLDQVEPAPSPTLHQLLTHTSGLSYSFNPGILAEHYAEHKLDFGADLGTLADAAAALASVPLAFQPGSSWNYSVGIDIIGRVLEVMTGKSLATVFQEQILDPLGMQDTSFALPHDKIERFADCFMKTPEDALWCNDYAATSYYLDGKIQMYSGGGGLLSTLDDYMRFGEMIRQGGSLGGEKLLGHKTVEFMRRNHLPGDIASMGPASFAEMPMVGMGFGIGGASVLDPAATRTPGSMGDFGWGGMASTYFWTDPVNDLNCVFFTQLIPSSAYPNRAELKALVQAALV